MRLTICIFILGFSTAACTLYQSTGREAIEKNAGNLVSSSGFDATFKNFYACTATAQVPAFLKEDLVVIEGPKDAEGYTVLAAMASQPNWVYVYTYNDTQKIHYSCQVHRLVSQTTDINNMIHSGVQEIIALETRQSSN